MSLTPDAFHGCHGRKVLVIEPYSYTPEIETGLEIAEILAANNAVTFAGPDALKCVTDESYRFTSRVLSNFSYKRYVSRFLSKSVRSYSRENLEVLCHRPATSEIVRLFDSAAGDLSGLCVGSFDLGMGILSSLISLTRDTSVDLTEYLDYSLALGRDSVWLYYLTKELVRREGFDLVVLFNGRLAPVRAIRRACEELGTQYFVHERGSSIGKYAIYDRAIPHQPKAYRGWVDTWWSYADDPVRNAQDFLARRRRGIATNWYAFTRKQEKGNVPPQSDRKRIAFFTSSEDELAAIGDEMRADTRFCDQSEAIRSVGRACRALNYELIIRFHPNTPATAQTLIQEAHASSATVIEPSSAADSYALADSSDVIFSPNSTIALEAAATGKPAYFTGRSVYEDCRSVRRIRTEDELHDALVTTAGADPLDALKYANYLGFHGIEYVHYKPNGILSGTYRGRNLNTPLATIRDLKLRIAHGGR